MDLKEELLYHIWKYRLFRMPLVDLDDRPVELVDPGQQNLDSGPDFFNARIRSEGILWAGNVEIHRKASEWYQHDHHMDPAYDNVILHVVLDPDCEIINSRGRIIKTVKMEISPEIHMRYTLLLNNPELIPCCRNLQDIDQGGMKLWLERLMIERLEERVMRIRADLKRCAGNWQEVLYESLARAFGQKINADPFGMLAHSVPIAKIIDHCPDLISKEALLFGQAGMLVADKQKKNIHKTNQESSDSDLHTMSRSLTDQDDYYSELCQRYRFQQNKLSLKSIDGYLWKFLRLRPDNFPTIRISQFACFLEKYPDLLSELLDQQDPLGFVLKMEIHASEYWDTHYRFRKESPRRKKTMGKDRMTGLFINAILPVLFANRQNNPRPSQTNDLTGILHRIPPEDNRIIRFWKSLGIEVPDGSSSQALLQLNNKYCIFKRCLSCYVGSQIIQSFPSKK